MSSVLREKWMQVVYNSLLRNGHYFFAMWLREKTSVFGLAPWKKSLSRTFSCVVCHMHDCTTFRYSCHFVFIHGPKMCFAWVNSFLVCVHAKYIASILTDFYRLFYALCCISRNCLKKYGEDLHKRNISYGVLRDWSSFIVKCQLSITTYFLNRLTLYLQKLFSQLRNFSGTLHASTYKGTGHF